MTSERKNEDILYSPNKKFGKRLGVMMRRFKFLLSAILYTVVLFLPLPAVLGNEGGCPTCKGSVLDPLGCCETENACTAPTSKAACDLMSGVFYLGDMSCDTETKCVGPTGPIKPTAIRLSSFNVSQEGAGSNLISWSTGTEIDTEGFHILRSTSSAGPYSIVTPSMIASTGSGISGGRYSFVDTAVEEGKSYYYKLEEVDVHGKLAQYGPVAAVAKAKEGAVSSEQLADQKTEDRQQKSEVRTYTIVANADGPVKFLSGEAADAERVHGIINAEAVEQKVEAGSQMSVVRSKKDVMAENSNDKAGAKNKITSASPRNDVQSPESIQFRIIDAEGNEIAVAIINQIAVSSKKSADEKETLQYKWDGDRIMLTWYATEPVKGVHILRSTEKNGTYQKITKTPIPYLSTAQKGKLFQYTYTDTKVEKGKDYYYKLETINDKDNKTALR